MKIEKVTIENFRGFSGKTIIDFGQLNVFIGKNDAGKSTVLEALDIFFNDGKAGHTKIDAEDKNKDHQDDDIFITVAFSHFPSEIVIDAQNKTSLADEYLLNDELLEIKKKYTTKPKSKPSVYIVAKHPTCESCEGILSKKITELKEIVLKNNYSHTSKAKSAELRKSIWDNCDDLKLKEIDIPVKELDIFMKEGKPSISEGKPKSIWEKIEKWLPAYSLFQSDRENKESDSEAQDPIRKAVQQVIETADLQAEFNTIANTVKGEIEIVLKKILDKLEEMSPKVAETLKPNIPDVSELKWADVFKGVGINSNDGVPLNKRGSGVKRLMLLSFFRAEAEKKQEEQNKSNIIYAMEEPETSQHIDHQKILIETFEKLSPNCQILLTTHSPFIVQLLAKGNHNLNLITKKDGAISIELGEKLLSQDQLALKYVSGNEISFLAFDHINAEFHTELYSFIENEEEELFRKINKHYECENPDKNIKKYYNDHPKRCKDEYITLHKYIRHQIHHPRNEGNPENNGGDPAKNKKNPKYTPEELRKSIEEMREWLLASD